MKKMTNTYCSVYLRYFNRSILKYTYQLFFLMLFYLLIATACKKEVDPIVSCTDQNALNIGEQKSCLFFWEALIGQWKTEDWIVKVWLVNDSGNIQEVPIDIPAKFVFQQDRTFQVEVGNSTANGTWHINQTSSSLQELILLYNNSRSFTSAIMETIRNQGIPVLCHTTGQEEWVLVDHDSNGKDLLLSTGENLNALDNGVVVSMDFRLLAD